MSAEENKAIVRRFVEEVQSQHKLESIDELVSPEFVNPEKISEEKARGRHDNMHCCEQV